MKLFIVGSFFALFTANMINTAFSSVDLIAKGVSAAVAIPAAKPSIVDHSTNKQDCRNSFLADRYWYMDEIRAIQGNRAFYYKQGDYEKSTVNFNNDRIIFYCEGTGIYIQGDGLTYKLSWHFLNEKGDAIEFNITQFRNNSDLLVTWDHITSKDNSISYVEYYTHATGVNSLAYAVRTTKDQKAEEVVP